MPIFNKPLVKNYFVLSAILLLFLFAYHFPDGQSYKEVGGTWVLIFPIHLALLLQTLKAFLMFFPGIILVFLIKKYLSAQESKILFLKIPPIIFLVSILMSFIYSFTYACSGEECLGKFLMFIYLPSFWVLAAFIFYFFIHIINKSQNLREKILKFIQNHSANKFLISLFIFSLIYLVLKVSFYLLMSSQPSLPPSYY